MDGEGELFLCVGGAVGLCDVCFWGFFAGERVMAVVSGGICGGKEALTKMLEVLGIRSWL